MSADSENLDLQVRSMQILAAALIAGVLAFGAICFVVAGGPIAGGERFMSIVAAVAALVQLGLYFVVPGVIRNNILRRSPPGAGGLLAAYRTGLVVGLALLEGAAFFNLIAYLIEQQWWTLAVVGALLFCMLVAFPTRARVEQWLENQTAFRN